MNGPEDRVDRFVEDILDGRRPRRFRPTDDEAEAIRGALEVRGAKVGAAVPDPDFVRRLEGKVLAEAGRGRFRALLSRRALLGTVGTAAAAMLVGGAVEHQLAASSAAPAEGSPTLAPEGGDWQQVAAVSELPQGEARRFSTDSVEGVVVNDGGSIRALSATCTHMGCILRPNPGAHRLDCPCHRTSFSWSGKVVFHQLKVAPASLPSIPSRVRDGQIEVYVV
jgi:cytochrome b6-f complex iron-sulfur subunit